jgi:hypothetical protein
VSGPILEPTDRDNAVTFDTHVTAKEGGTRSVSDSTAEE